MKKFLQSFKRWHIGALLLLLAQLCYGQIKVSGTVVDLEDQQPLVGVSIVVKGTTTGTLTDVNGKYTISVPKNAVLVFSFTGFDAQSVAVASKNLINVVLKAAPNQLSEVVVVGYGTQKKKELTGAVSSISSSEMIKVVASDFTKTLQGQIAGVNVTESSGRPGDKANIQIRGLGSISSNAEPLYVVDGIPFNSNPNIASEEIETVDVLKDGASAAIYGTRASNGVILITTKRGAVGKSKVEYSSYYGFQNITSGTPLMNTKEFLYVDELRQVAQGSRSNILFYNPDALNYNTDFVGAITRNNAPIQNHNVVISGGKENLKFNINTNYFGQKGVLINSDYGRISTRANATFDKGKFHAFASIGFLHSDKTNEPWSLYEYAVFQGPYRKPLNELATTENSVVIGGQNPDHVSFLSRLLNDSNAQKEDSYNLSGNLKYDITKGLTFQTNLGYNYYNNTSTLWQPQYLVYDRDGDLNVLGSREKALLQKGFYNSRKLTLENVLTYTKSFNGHSFTGLVGYTIEKTVSETFGAQKRDFLSNNIRVFDSGNELVNISGSQITQGIVGKLARLQYNFKDRYLMSVSLRNDASSNFGPQNRYAYFPGVSVGWNLMEENFMKSIRNITSLKLRASYGKVGNQGIRPYLYAAFIDNNIDYVWGPESSDKLAGGAIQRGYGNPNVKWETNVARNIGIDLVLFNGKFTFTGDIYNNNKQDMLLSVLLPPSTGTTVPRDWANQYNSIISNVGDMTNKGIELSGTYRFKTSNGLSMNITGNFTRNRNKVTSLGDLDRIPLPNSRPGNWRSFEQDVTTYMVPGYAAGSFFLIPTNGIFKTQEQLNNYTYTDASGNKKRIQPNAQLGDVIYVDTNNDGKIDDADRVYAGSGMPKFEFGSVINAEYKGFDVNIQLYYSYGNKVYNGAKLFAYSMGRHKDLYYMWTPQNATSDVPTSRVNSAHENYRTRGDYFLEDGSFLRAKNLTLGYSLPKTLISKAKLTNVRLYASAQNAFTLTKYKGYDPEVGGDGITNRGVDRANYPITRKIIFGLQIGF